MLDRTRREAPLLLGRNADIDLGRDSARNLALQGQCVAAVPLIALRPNMVFVTRRDQLRRDPHPVSRGQNCSFHDVVHPELLGDFGQWSLALLESQYRSS